MQEIPNNPTLKNQFLICVEGEFPLLLIAGGGENCDIENGRAPQDRMNLWAMNELLHSTASALLQQPYAIRMSLGRIR
ncbi:Hypothetical predicted protein [Olea europaea subsp. europaea]|uniref:Uncharacterized protein n=1 Tax=Olea europaea subsp. europaea TaxID=158383 RepID=A0A8S0SQS2_OLEEU|nr:Hypothetical predicted protein [Olea europaea subsp. europaea]